MSNEITKESIDATVAGMTVPSMFATTVADHGERVALRWKEGEEWREMTYSDWADASCRAAAGLAEAGVGAGDRVVLMMRNRPEFHVLDMAALFLGATPLSIYNSSAPEQVAYLAGHSKASLAVVEDANFLERFAKVRSELPELKTLFVVDEPDGGAPDDVGTYADLLAHDPLDLNEASKVAKPEDLATVIYTSGTTGPPKGVKLSHYNIAWTVQSYLEMLDIEPVGFRAISYLPMAHVAERMSTYYLAVAGGYEISTCPEPTLLAAYATEVHPEIMFGVPRVWEKIYAGVNAALGADPEKKQKFDEAVAAALPLQMAKRTRDLTEDEATTLGFLDEVAFAQVRALVGLDACQYAVTGAAPIPVEILEWFVAIGVPISEIYGMSENTGPLTWEPVKIRPGTVGRAMAGCTVKLGDDGEVLGKGGNIFEGYLDDPEKTAEALDADGWLHTGDIGVIDDDGFLRIVDRKKELIITAGGKNISPANLEAALKMIPLVGQACAIGDQKPFVSALLVLDPDAAKTWATSHGQEGASLAELATNADVITEVEAGLGDVMASFNNAERVKKVTILGEEWLPDSEELTPTSKLKRRGVHSKYASEISALYDAG